jgi:hypothetical protein
MLDYKYHISHNVKKIINTPSEIYENNAYPVKTSKIINHNSCILFKCLFFNNSPPPSPSLENRGG